MPRYAGAVSNRLRLVLSFLLLSLAHCVAYRVGDAVDTMLRTSLEAKEALRSQMPMFGVNSIAEFKGSPRSFSLSFEEGLRALPWFDLKNSRGNPLEYVTVTFVYSRSGDGSIHAISSSASYSSKRGKTADGDGFQVKYTWIEEEGVDVAGGSAVMMLATLIVAIVFFLQMCSTGIDELSSQRRDDGIAMSDTASYASYGDQLSIGSGGASVPKWD